MNINYEDVPVPGRSEWPLTCLLASCLPNLISSSLYCQIQLPKSPFLSGYFQSSMASFCPQNKTQAPCTDIQGFLLILLQLLFLAYFSSLTYTNSKLQLKWSLSISFCTLSVSSSWSRHYFCLENTFHPLHSHLVDKYRVLSYGSGPVLATRDTAINKTARAMFSWSL